MIKMRPLFRLIVLVGLALILPGQISLSGAQGVGGSVPRTAMSGQNLMQFCHSKYDVDAGFCSGYIAAVAEVMTVQQAYAQNACDHAMVKPQQLMDMVKIETDASPSLAQLPAGVMVAHILAMAYPCQTGAVQGSGAPGDYTVESLPAPIPPFRP